MGWATEETDTWREDEVAMSNLSNVDGFNL